MGLFQNIKNLYAQTKTLKAQAQPERKRILPWKSKSIWQTQQDIRSWKRAENMFNSEDPRNFPLQILFDEITKDALLSSQMNSRIKQVLSQPFVLKKPNGEVDEQATKVLSTHPITRQLTKTGLEILHYGYNLVELSVNPNTNMLVVEVLPRTNIVPQLGLFYKDCNDATGILYRDLAEYGTWILEYDTKTMGLLNKAIPHVLFKRFAQSCWSELCEIYGIPPRYMKTNTNDPAMLERAEKMMADMGSAAWFIIDESEDFQFADNVNTKGEVYQNLIQLCNNELSLLISGAIIGQNDPNGTLAKEKVSQDLQWYLVQDDMKMSEEQWNNINIPALVKHGVIPQGLIFEYEKSENLAQLWTFTKDTFGYFDQDIDWLNQKFNLKLIAKKDTTNTGLSHQAKPFFLKASTEIEALKNDNCCGQAHIFKLSGNLNNDKLINRYWTDQGTRQFDAELFQYTVKNLTEAFSKGWKTSKDAKLSALGIDYGLDDPNALTAYEMNLFRFGGIKTLAESQLLNKAFRESSSFEDFSIRASLITKIHNTEWLRTEYNTALSVGETSATYQRLKSKTDLYPYWEYRTINDTIVRPEHRLLDGLILPANHPLWSKLYPPNGWNCRCYIVPRLASELNGQDIEANIKIFEEFIGSDEFLKATKSGWGINRAEQEQVFTANQQYISRITEANKLLSNLGPGDYKIKEVTNKPARTIYNGTAEEFLKENELDFNDYSKRKIKGIAEVITSSEPELLQELDNVLNKPDEVWYQAEEKNQTFNRYLYIKYYEDTPIALIAEYQEGSLRIVNFFKMLDQLIRWGLLIK